MSSLPKQITFLADNEDLLTSTVKEFSGPVISTLGPGGCTVIIANDEGLPHVTKDGVTVSESIFFKDPRKQAIASLIKEAARKTASAVGDGTTTSVVLAQAMILDGVKALKKSSSKKEFFDGFDLAVERISDYLEESSVVIAKDSELLESVVRISTNGDEKVCSTVMSAVKAAGADGIVNVELHDELTTVVSVKNGASMESKAITLGNKVWEREGKTTLVLVAGALTKVHEIHNLVVAFSRNGNSGIIIAKEFSEEVISTVLINNKNKRTDIVLVEAEGFARESRGEILDDLGAIFDVPVYSLDGSTGVRLSDLVIEDTVELFKAIVTPTETILFRTNENLSPEAEARYEVLLSDYKEAKASTEVLDSGGLRHLQRRMAKYNVVATIKVGASTKAEAEEIKDRIDDAICAISAAINGGITQGGGMALARAAYAANDDKVKPIIGFDGYEIVVKSCTAPIRLLALNAGTIVGKPVESDNVDIVYDFKSCEFVNWLEGGIIDPTLVPISALTNAASVAKTILKSNSIISEWQDTVGE